MVLAKSVEVETQALMEHTVSIGQAAGILNESIDGTMKLVRGGDIRAIYTFFSGVRIFKESLLQWIS